MKVLDLFAGLGGFSLAAHWAGHETVGICEIDPFCQSLLKDNFKGVKIHNDVKDIKDFEIYKGKVDVITGGYPCQPFSQAGRRGGSADPRHLWPNMLDIVRLIDPAWVIAENVAGHINLGLDKVCLDLETTGYSVKVFIIPAVAVNARHRRDRLWIIAHKKEALTPAIDSLNNNLEMPPLIGVPPTINSDIKVKNRPARIKALGNSIVPQIAYEIFKAIGRGENKRPLVDGSKDAFNVINSKDPLSFVCKGLLYAPWASDVCDLKWVIKSTLESRILFKLVPKVKSEFKHTYGLMPTPRATEIWEPIEKYRERMKNSKHKKNQGKTKPGNVSIAVQVPHKYIFMLPTPSAMEHKRCLTISDSQSSKCISAKANRGELSSPPGRLNPNFVEALMGYPTDWTKPKNT